MADATTLFNWNDLVDGALLGLNLLKRPKFRLRTKCIPLAMDQGFVEVNPGNDKHEETWYNYYLGQLCEQENFCTNLTFQVRGKPFDSLFPGYAIT